MTELLMSRRLWGGVLSIIGALTGAATVPVETTESMVSTVVVVVGGLLSILSKLFPSRT